MGNELRRKGMVKAEEVNPYPFEAQNPVFEEYGIFKLTPLSGNGSLNVHLKSGSTTYSYLGAFEWNKTVTLTITEDTISYVQQNSTKEKAFAGFPVQFIRPYGTVIYSVDKIG